MDPLPDTWRVEIERLARIPPRHKPEDVSAKPNLSQSLFELIVRISAPWSYAIGQVKRRDLHVANKDRWIELMAERIRQDEALMHLDPKGPEFEAIVHEIELTIAKELNAHSSEPSEPGSGA